MENENIKEEIKEEVKNETFAEDKKEEAKETHEEVERKLYRDNDDRVIAGVASGLAIYFDIKTGIMRILFLVFLITWGASILVYIILWIVIPKAVTEKQKAEMNAKKTNYNNLKDIIKR